jgi:hypothetical protein
MFNLFSVFSWTFTSLPKFQSFVRIFLGPLKRNRGKKKKRMSGMWDVLSSQRLA